MSFTTEGFTSGGYLYAMAHLGNFAVLPMTSRSCRSSSFTTAPSMSKGNCSLPSPSAAISARMSSGVLSRLWGMTLKCWLAR